MNVLRLSLCLLSLTLTPAVAAGAEVPDASRDASPPAANAWADIARVTLDVGDDALLLGLDAAALPALQPGAAYVVVFGSGDLQWYGVLAAAPTPRWFTGAWADDAPVDQEPTTGTYATGAPGRVEISFPRDRLPADVRAIDALGAVALDIRPQLARLPPVVHDEAEGAVAVLLSADADIAAAAVEDAPAELAAVRAETPGSGVGLLAAAATVAVAARRRWRA